MPIYEYSCRACGHEFELLQKISDRPVRKCERCGKLQAKRHISQTSFLLKGTGWYTTDYAGHKAHGSSESEPAPTATASSPESKPAEKPVDKPVDKPAAKKPAPQKSASA